MKNLKTIEAIEKYNWPYHKTKVCELTLNYNCNAHCVFCYSSPEIESWKNKGLLDIKKATQYMMDSYKSGARLLQAIGGEPTIYPALPEILSLARKIGYPIIQIVTNGQRMADYSYAKKLRDSGLNTVTFSLHAPEPKLHDRIVGLDNAFRNIIKAIENSIKLNIYINIGTAVNSLNYKKIPKLAEFIYENYSIESYHFVAMHFIGGAEENREKLKTSYSQTLPYLKKALYYLSEKRIMAIAPILSNYQPCLLPGLEHLISDWMYPFNDDDLYLPEKVYRESMYTMITNTLRMKGKKCDECIYSKLCAGFEKKYFEIYGDREFKPLKSVAKPFPIAVFYRR